MLKCILLSTYCVSLFYKVLKSILWKKCFCTSCLYFEKLLVSFVLCCVIRFHLARTGIPTFSLFLIIIILTYFYRIDNACTTSLHVDMLFPLLHCTLSVGVTKNDIFRVFKKTTKTINSFVFISIHHIYKNEYHIIYHKPTVYIFATKLHNTK